MGPSERKRRVHLMVEDRERIKNKDPRDLLHRAQDVVRDIPPSDGREFSADFQRFTCGDYLWETSGADAVTRESQLQIGNIVIMMLKIMVLIIIIIMAVLLQMFIPRG